MISGAASFKYCSRFLICTTAVAAAVKMKRLSQSQFKQDAGTAKKQQQPKTLDWERFHRGWLHKRGLNLSRLHKHGNEQSDHMVGTCTITLDNVGPYMSMHRPVQLATDQDEYSSPTTVFVKATLILP